MPIPDNYAGGAPASKITPQEYNVAYEQAAERFFTASDRDDVVALRDAVQRLGGLVDLLVPPGRNKALALTALEDVQMRANRGIFAPEDLR